MVGEKGEMGVNKLCIETDKLQPVIAELQSAPTWRVKQIKWTLECRNKEVYLMKWPVCVFFRVGLPALGGYINTMMSLYHSVHSDENIAIICHPALTVMIIPCVVKAIYTN